MHIKQREHSTGHLNIQQRRLLAMAISKRWRWRLFTRPEEYSSSQHILQYLHYAQAIHLGNILITTHSRKGNPDGVKLKWLWMMNGASIDRNYCENEVQMEIVRTRSGHGSPHAARRTMAINKYKAQIADTIPTYIICMYIVSRATLHYCLLRDIRPQTLCLLCCILFSSPLFSLIILLFSSNLHTLTGFSSLDNESSHRKNNSDKALWGIIRPGMCDRGILNVRTQFGWAKRVTLLNVLISMCNTRG